MKKISMISFVISFFISAFALQASAQVIEKDSIQLGENDGPYIFSRKYGYSVLRVSDYKVSIEQSKSSKQQSFNVVSDNGKHQFDVRLHKVYRPDWKYDQPEKLMVISDPHGNMDAFVSILKSQKVIDNNYTWSFGTNHLVIIGDVFDRGRDVLPIFWLIYKLEYEANKSGGAVHFLLGNHEEMVLKGDLRYTQPKYTQLAKLLNTSYEKLWSDNQVLGHWLQTRNLMEVIGDNLFVHAGLSEDFAAQNWQISQLNQVVSSYLPLTRKERNKSKIAKFLFGSVGPLWYRGMVHREEKYKPIELGAVDKILKQYNVKRICVGHTIFEDVSTFFDNKVIAVNVDNQKNWDAGRSRGVIIEKKKIRKIYDDSNKSDIIQ